MPRIRCHYIDCVFLDDGYCSAAAIEVDPSEGCMTYSPAGDYESETSWEEDEEEELEVWEDLEEDEEDEELWLDDEEY